MFANVGSQPQQYDIARTKLPTAKGDDVPSASVSGSLRRKVVKMDQSHPVYYYVALGVAAAAAVAFSAYQSLYGNHKIGSISDVAILIAFLAGCWLYKTKTERDAKFDEEQKEIQKIKDPWLKGHPPEVLLNKSRDEKYDRIFNGLYLGNDLGFATTTHLPCERMLNSKIDTVDTKNWGRFEQVLTVCPLKELQGRLNYKIGDLKQFEETLSASFTAHKIVWFYVGKDVPDEEQSWDDFVYNCTFGEPPTKGTKSEIIQTIQVKDWFLPVFDMLDKGAALSRCKRTLIHCSDGVSRGPALLAAYLIRRRSLSVEEACAFLRSRRICVNPVFMPQLQAYAHALDNLPELYD